MEKREIQEERMKINSEVVGKKQYTNTIKTHLMGGDLLEDQLQTQIEQKKEQRAYDKQLKQKNV